MADANGPSLAEAMRRLQREIEAAHRAHLALAPFLLAAFAGTYRVSHRPRWWSSAREYVSPPQRFRDAEDALLALEDRGYRRLRIKKTADEESDV
jgi:hypothetical protein